MRLNKFLANCGVASRRKCDSIIAVGRVSVNGGIVREMGAEIDQNDEVKVDGEPIKPVSRRTYILLNKPKGYVTTVKDTHGRPTVLDLVKTDRRLFPVGRLDVDSEGLLLLTDDGDLANAVLHPRHKVEKRYLVDVDKEVRAAQISKLEAGIVLSDGPTAPCSVYPQEAEKQPRGNRLEVVLREGRNRQIRRMFTALGLRVVRLRRVGFGPIQLGGVKSGRWRHLSLKEIALLRESTRGGKRE